jgi:N-acetylneuraminic acid mutarotase
VKKRRFAITLLLSCILALTVTGSSTLAASASSTAALPSSWMDLNPVGDLPAARETHSMVYDEASGLMILFGGILLNVDGGYRPYDDTWAYDPSANTWTNLRPAGDLPTARGGPAMVYVPATGKTILFGGFSDNRDYSDMWAYDSVANVWVELVPAGDRPSSRAGHRMVYDSASGKLLLFGGWAYGHGLNDIWSYDPVANTWDDLKPAGAAPSARMNCSLVYDPDTGTVILFGGLGDGSVFFNDTWAYDPSANTWTNLRPAGDLPTARAASSMVYDPVSHRMILFGGNITNVAFNDTWTYDPAANAWTARGLAEITPENKPNCSMVYDPVRHRMVLFAGGGSNDTWALAGAIPASSDLDSVPLPTEISRDPGVIGTNSVLAVIFVVLFGFTSTLFNSTLKANRNELIELFIPVTRRVKSTTKTTVRLLRRLATRVTASLPQPTWLRVGSFRRLRASRLWLETAAIVFVTGFLYAIRDSGFGWSVQGLQLFVAFAVAMTAVTYSYEGTQTLTSSRAYGLPARIRLLPSALAIAVFCILLSRVSGFRPGYVYGFVGGLAFLTAQRPDTARAGRLTLLGTGCLLVVSLAAWFAAEPLARSVEAGNSGLTVLLRICKAVFLAGLQGVTFRLVPLKFMGGQALFRWNKWLWGGSFLVSGFLFWHVLLNRDGTSLQAFENTSVQVVVGIFVFWTLVTIATYLFFRRSPKQLAVTSVSETVTALSAEETPVPLAQPESDDHPQNAKAAQKSRDSRRARSADSGRCAASKAAGSFAQDLRTPSSNGDTEMQ